MNKTVRTLEQRTPPEELVKRFAHTRGGGVAFRKQTAAKKLAFLRGDAKIPGSRLRRFLKPRPVVPSRKEPFELTFSPGGAPEKTIAMVKLTVQFPSGKVRKLTFRPTLSECRNGKFTVSGFKSGAAGHLYISARVYYNDGSTLSDAFLTTVVSHNPHQLVISPRTWLVSGRAGRVEYDWDDNEFHCRAYGTITNGESSSITYNSCRVRVTDGGISGTLIDEFSFTVGPFTVAPGGTANRSVDTWYPQGSSVWDKFNRRWDLTLQFTYESTGSASVSDSAAYRPMSTIPINAIKCDDFTSAQTQAERDAVAIAAEILEDRDVTLYGPNWRVISSEANKSKYGIIDIGWTGSTWDWEEIDEMYEDISGPEQDRLDVFIPLGFTYESDVPSDKRNVGGVSTINGPFPKDDDPDKSGCLVLLDENDVDFFGVAIAHEICHYLGLNHVADSQDNNLMHKNGGLTDHKLTWDQWNTIRQHGMMKWLAADI
jgi:hypothetical protein